MEKQKLKAFLDGLYYVYARRELVNPDPLFFLYTYHDVKDREIAALIASSLAYGRVAQIMKSVERVLACLTDRPYTFLMDNHNFEIVPESFKHRFTTSFDVNNMLANVKAIIREFGSLEALMAHCLKQSGGDFTNALDMFSSYLGQGRRKGAFSLVPTPKDGSACKRLMLFLRWLVRHEDVDPGGWSVISPAQLVIPVDVHMHRLALTLGLTERATPDWECAVGISASLSVASPSDPAKYDFPLTRFGIRTLNEAYIITKL